MSRRLLTALLMTAAMASASSAYAAAPAPSAFDAAIGRAKSSMMGDPKSALAASRDALVVAKDGPGDPALRQATAQWLEGEALIRIGQAKQATPIIEQAISVVACLA